MSTPFSLYVHIPFCAKRCPYCDFNTYVEDRVPEQEYVAALGAELSFRAALPEWHGRPVRTIYFGGGTPSLFRPSAIEAIIERICLLFPVEETAEISLEANPGTVTRESLCGYRDAGINRLSLGAQSFTPHVLQALGRDHSVDDTLRAVAEARAVGFTNLSVDLIFGAPRQSLSEFKHDIREALRLQVEHISAYGLTIEKGTPFYQRFKSGLLKLPSEGTVVRMLEELVSLTSFHGYRRYEISNFARKGREARHNLAYWNCEDYLGLGAGAHSYFGITPSGSDPGYGKRWANFALPQSYIEAASRSGIAESWNDYLTREDAMFEFFFLGLRKIEGVSVRDFEAKFSSPLGVIYRGALQVLVTEELIATESDRLFLTERGLLVMDSVLENFVSPESQPDVHATVRRSELPTTDRVGLAANQ